MLSPSPSPYLSRSPSFSPISVSLSLPPGCAVVTVDRFSTLCADFSSLQTTVDVGPACIRRYIWQDGNGVYHAIAHCFNPFFSAHAFVDPANVPTNWSDPAQPMVWTVTGNPYGGTVAFTDGTNFSFSRRERPVKCQGEAPYVRI